MTMTRATARGQEGGATPPGPAAQAAAQKPQTRRATRSSRPTAGKAAAAIAAAAAGPATDESPDPAQQLHHEADEAGQTRPKASLAQFTPARRGAPNQDPALSIAPSVASRRPNEDDEEDEEEAEVEDGNREGEEGEQEEEQEQEQEVDEDDDEEEEDNEAHPKKDAPKASSGEAKRQQQQIPPSAQGPSHPPHSLEQRGPSREGAMRPAVEAPTRGSAEEEVRTSVRQEFLAKLAQASDDLLKSLSNPDSSNLFARGRLEVQSNIFIAVYQSFLDDPSQPIADWEWLRDARNASSEYVRHAKVALVFANIAHALSWIDLIFSSPTPPEGPQHPLDMLGMLDLLDRTFPRLFLLPGRESSQFSQLALDIRTALWIEKMVQEGGSPDMLAAQVFCEQPAGDLAGYDAQKWIHLFTKGPFRSMGNLRDQELVGLCSERIANATAFLPKPRLGPVIIKDASDLKKLRDAFPLNTLLISLREWLLRIYSSSRTLLEDTYYRLLSAQSKARDSSRSLFQSGADIARLYNDTASAVPDDDDEDDDDDDLHTDALNPSASFAPGTKRPRSTFAASSAAYPSPKRPRPGRPRTHRGPHHPPSSAPAHTHTHPPTSSAMPDIEQVQRQKEQTLKELRAKSSASPKPRYVWSQHDTTRLIKCIDLRDAQWANIEKHDQALFEIPRNQQAYRDKARNLKVDFLIADAPLPPKFDKVALGRKEVERLQKCNKNPYRKEADVDEHGTPVNTSVLPRVPDPDPNPDADADADGDADADADVDAEADAEAEAEPSQEAPTQEAPAAEAREGQESVAPTQA